MRHELLICKSEFGIEVKCKLEITINIKWYMPDLQVRVNICFILCAPGDRYSVHMNRCECSNCMDAVSLDKTDEQMASLSQSVNVKTAPV